jgi:hypothetical protein
MPELDIIFRNPLITAVIVSALILFLIILWRGQKMPYVAQEALLTKAELKFYHILKHCVPNGCAIMMKVRMGDIITCTDTQWRAGWGPKISAKHIDFILIDPQTTKILCAIELDDSTHRTNSDRIDRDKFVNKAFETAGVPLLRVPVQGFYDQKELKAKITQTNVLDRPQIQTRSFPAKSR